jgi:hypothetical protein
MKVEKEAINSKPTHVDFPGMDDTERKMQRMTFQTNDWFERIDFAKNLCSLIQHCDDLKENESFSIAIDASWGMGKTQFIHMWRNLVIEKKDQLPWHTVYYNAWKHDDYDDALVPLVCNIYQALKRDGEDEKRLLDVTKKILKLGFSGLIRVACASIPGLEALTDTGRDIVDILGEKQAEVFFDNYVQRENAKDEFRLTIKNAVGEDEKLIIIIDELDRCKPLFAIKTLEIMKHFFNIDKVVFVFALDIIQLSKAIETVYGQGMDACGYLMRFFDCQLKLNTPTWNVYDKSYNPEENTFIEKLFLETIDFFDLSAREVIILLRNVNIAQEIVNPHHLAICKVALFILFSVKYKKPQLYMDIFKGEEIKAGEVQVTSDNYIYTFLNFIATIANEYTFDVINKLSDLDKQRNNTPWMNSVIEFLYRVSIPASTKEKYGEALRRYLEIYAPVV